MFQATTQKLLISIIIGITLMSCSTEFEPHLMSNSTPVLYGIINPDDSLYQVRLTKSFIGPGNAMDFAVIPDSIYYQNARVYLETRRFNGNLIERVELIPTEIEPREQGVFASLPNIVYQTDFRSIRLREDLFAQDGITFEVDLFVIADIPDHKESLTSSTRLKSRPNIINPKWGFQKVYLYNSVPFYLEWTHGDPNTYFEIQVIMNYREIIEGGEREAQIDWTLRGINLNENKYPYGTTTNYSYYFRPENFYSHIRAAIKNNPEVRGRIIRNLDFIILTSDKAVKDFNDTEKIADDYNGASYTNISNGLGLFASFNTKGFYSLRLGQRELDSLAFGSFTKHLNFKNWE